MEKLRKTPAMQKSYDLAVEIVKFSRNLIHEKKEFVLGRQILKSGTSIGANVAEAHGGISKADFSAKISIAYKEGLETKYWLNLLRDSSLLAEEEFLFLLEKIDEVCRILYAILKKSRYDTQ